MIRYKDLEPINMLQEIFIKETGNKISIMEKDKCNLQMVLNMKVAGKIIKCMGKENLKIMME